jgi:hypothetical protein
VGRHRPLVLAAALALVAPLAAAQAPRPSPTPRPPARATTVPPKRVFTNDDLEESRKRPSAVQDLQAKEGTVGYEHADESSEPRPAQPTPEPTPSYEEQQQQQIAAAEEQVRQLDQRAKDLLWQYLQSTDTNEILRLKAEQQEVLNQLEAAKAELARLRGEAPAGGGPPPEPTRQPG